MAKATGLCYNKVALEQGRKPKIKYLSNALILEFSGNFTLYR